MAREEKSGNLSDLQDSVLAMDADGVIVEWSEAARGIFGWSREQVMGRRLSSVIIPERHREAHEYGLRRFLKSGQGALLGRAIEIVALDHEGREFPVEIKITAEKTGSGWRFATVARRAESK